MPATNSTRPRTDRKVTPFRMVPDRMAYDPRLEAIDIRLWCVMSHIGRYHAHCIATDNALATRLRVSVPTVQRSLVRLQKAGYIRRFRHQKGDRRITLRPEGDRATVTLPGDPPICKFADLDGAVTPERLAELRTMPYAEYLQTEEWKLKRNWVQADDGHACRLCNRPAGEVILDVHHRTYERRGTEDRLDLITICRDCHERHHGK